MNKEEKITISVNEEDIQNIINAYEKDIEYINQLEKENQELKKIVELYSKSLYNAELTKYKEVIEKAIEWVKDWTHGANDWFEEDSKPSELLDILKEVK